MLLTKTIQPSAHPKWEEDAEDAISTVSKQCAPISKWMAQVIVATRMVAVRGDGYARALYADSNHFRVSYTSITYKMSKKKKGEAIHAMSSLRSGS
jgi:hypothetical protein